MKTFATFLKAKKMWLEDISGSNLLVTPELNIYLIDLDSLRGSDFCLLYYYYY